MQNYGGALILNELEVFICKAFKGEAIVNYASALITQQMEASSSPLYLQVKINEKKDFHPLNVIGILNVFDELHSNLWLDI